MNKLLTIIVPTYNMEDYLHKCLSSLIVDDEELMNMLEVIVVNDGSNDKSSDIAHEYMDNYPNTFKVIDKENGNYGSCVNCGLKETNGKYVKVLDADDWFDTENFKELLGVLTNTEADVIFHYAQAINDKGKNKRMYGLKPKFFSHFEEGRTSFTMEELVEQDDFYPMMHNTTIKTKFFLDINYKQLEGIFYTDNQWGFLPVAKAKTIELFPKVVYKYLLGREGQSVSKQLLISHFGDEMLVTKQLMSDYLSYNGDDLERRYLKHYFHNHLRILLHCGILDESRYREKDLRRLDNMLKEARYPHYEEMNSWKIYSYSYRHTVTIGFWRKWDGRWFYLLEGMVKFLWDPYKKLKSLYPALFRREEMSICAG